MLSDRRIVFFIFRLNEKNDQLIKCNHFFYFIAFDLLALPIHSINLTTPVGRIGKSF